MDERIETIKEAVNKANDAEPISLAEWKENNKRHKLFMLSSDENFGWGIINAPKDEILLEYKKEAEKLFPDRKFAIV